MIFDISKCHQLVVCAGRSGSDNIAQILPLFDSECNFRKSISCFFLSSLFSEFCLEVSVDLFCLGVSVGTVFDPELLTAAYRKPLLAKIIIHSGCEIEEDFVETYIRKLCVFLRSRVLLGVWSH